MSATEAVEGRVQEVCASGDVVAGVVLPDQPEVVALPADVLPVVLAGVLGVVTAGTWFVTGSPSVMVTVGSVTAVACAVVDWRTR